MNDAPAFAARHPALRRVIASSRAADAIARTAYRFTERANRPINPERTA